VTGLLRVSLTLTCGDEGRRWKDPDHARALTPMIASLPDALRRTLTWDQGKEMAEHALIAIEADIDIFFGDPHSPWQRGSNENTNGMSASTGPRARHASTHPGRLRRGRPPDEHPAPSDPGMEGSTRGPQRGPRCDSRLRPPSAARRSDAPTVKARLCDLWDSTQKSNGVVHREHGFDVHPCVRTSTSAGRTGVTPLSAVSRVGRLADILPTQHQGHDLRKRGSGGRIFIRWNGYTGGDRVILIRVFNDIIGPDARTDAFHGLFEAPRHQDRHDA